MKSEGYACFNNVRLIHYMENQINIHDDDA